MSQRAEKYARNMERRTGALEERAALGDLLARAGVVRVTEPGEMSRTVPGEAHDGIYPLRAYSRVVELT